MHITISFLFPLFPLLSSSPPFRPLLSQVSMMSRKFLVTHRSGSQTVEEIEGLGDKLNGDEDELTQVKRILMRRGIKPIHITVFNGSADGTY